MTPPRPCLRSLCPSHSPQPTVVSYTRVSTGGTVAGWEGDPEVPDPSFPEGRDNISPASSLAHTHHLSLIHTHNHSLSTLITPSHAHSLTHFPPHTQPHRSRRREPCSHSTPDFDAGRQDLGALTALLHPGFSGPRPVVPTRVAWGDRVTYQRLPATRPSGPAVHLRPPLPWQRGPPRSTSPSPQTQRFVLFCCVF